MNISGNTVFIPGATSGIGLALALALRDKGNEVIVGGRRTEMLDRIVDEHPGIHAYRIDTADPQSVAEVSARVIAEHPEVNVLIPMAGIMRVEDWTDPVGFLASAEQIVVTNVLGPIRLIAAFIEHLQSRPDATIVTVSSGLAFTPLKVTPSYNASKAAIHMLSESIRLQLDRTSVGGHRPPAGPQGERLGDAARRLHHGGHRPHRDAAGGEGDPGRERQVPALRRGPRRL
jgi:uncharacterized oxidoreductase